MGVQVIGGITYGCLSSGTTKRNLGPGDQNGVRALYPYHKADVGNYVPLNGQFYVSRSTGSGLQTATLWSSLVGYSQEVRFIADYNGDGKADVGNYVPANGQFYVSLSTGSGFQAATLWSSLVGDRKSTRLNSSHIQKSRMPSSA